MEFESPDVMKDFPGLFGAEPGKKGSNDSDYSDETDKLGKKDLLKRKEKKDKKDKDRGYAALEGESSADENDSSPSKIKKSKAFKFSTKSKEKREKSKEKDLIDKKVKEKKNDKKVDKVKKERKCKSADEHADLADGMPIFGVPLDIAVERSRCHDGIDIPLPIRSCIDYVQSVGLTMEGVYKVSGPKAKVIQLRKLYNHREHVDLSDYEIPVVTGLLKLFLRDLPEPVFTTDLLVRFEEAGAILNVGTREKHLKILVDNLPPANRLLLSWLLIHFDDVVLNERLNKMNITHVVGTLAPAMHTSNRLLTALIHHCRALFPTVILEPYIPPLSSSALLPIDLDSLELELKKQESLLAQIHAEMNAGYIIKTREELLWEVQRTITQLKRKIKNLQKGEERVKEEPSPISSAPAAQNHSTVVPIEPTVNAVHVDYHCHQTNQHEAPHADKDPQRNSIPPAAQPAQVEQSFHSSPPSSTTATDTYNLTNAAVESPEMGQPSSPKAAQIDQITNHIHRNVIKTSQQSNTDEAIALLQIKHNALCELRDKLTKNIQAERHEIASLKGQIMVEQSAAIPNYTKDSNMEEIMTLLHKENQILEIKKINLVRQIMEQEEMCIDLRSNLILISN